MNILRFEERGSGVLAAFTKRAPWAFSGFGGRAVLAHGRSFFDKRRGRRFPAFASRGLFATLGLYVYCLRRCVFALALALEVLPSFADEVVSSAAGGWFAVDGRVVKDTTWEGGAIVGGATNVLLQSSPNAWGEAGGGSSATITWEDTSGNSGTVAAATTAETVLWTPEAQSGTNTLTYMSGSVVKTAFFAVVCIRPDGGPYVEIVDGIAWTFVVTNGQAVVASVPKDVAGDVAVPSVLGGRSVMSIGVDAFSGCTALSSVTIPSSVTSVEDTAFCYCGCLANITISKGVTSIGRFAFYGCGMKNITLPSSVMNIGDYAFFGCGVDTVVFEGLPPDGLASACLNQDAAIRYNVAYQEEWLPVISECGFTNAMVYDPDAIDSLPDGYGYTEKIGDYTWTFSVIDGEAEIGVRDANGTAQNICAISPTPEGSVIFPAALGQHKVTRVGCHAFGCCGSVTNITLPHGLKHIGERAFAGDYVNAGCGLIDLTIPEGVTSIGKWAFGCCRGLKRISVPSSVASIGEEAFAGCDIEECVVDESNLYYKSENGLLLTKDGSNIVAIAGTDVEIPSTITKINAYQFYDNHGLECVTISEGVKEIGNWAFGFCSGLTSVTIPSSVLSIGVYAFYECTSLTNVTIYNGVTSIAENMFAKCNRLTTITIPSSVTSIGSYAFYQCSLTSVTIPGGVTSVGKLAFGECSGLTTFSVEETNPNYKSENGLLLTKDGKMLVAGVNGIVAIPEGVTNIGHFAFCRCSGLTSVTIPASVTSIGDRAFLECYGVNEVYFEGAPPRGVESVDISRYAAIRYNAAYEAEWLPVMAMCGFVNASPYTPLKSDGGPYTETIDGIAWTFMVTNGGAVVASVPKDVAGDVTIPSVLGGRSVVGIGARAMSGCEGVTSVTIPSGVAKIGAEAFYGCPLLTDVTFEGETVASIAGDAFAQCNWDLVVHVPDGWTGRSTTLFGHSVVRDGAADPLRVELTVTNVVVQYVLNSVQPEIAVPVSGDTGFVAVITEVKSSGAVSVPSEWKDNYPGFAAKYGSDIGKALMKKTGKKDGVGNDMLVWQDYVAGTDPTDEDDVFTASITLVDGVPVISYTPELTAEQKALRVYKTYGKQQLQDTAWTDITGFDGEAKKPYNFFKVTVEMK